MDIDIESLSPRTVIVVGLLGLIPALWYGIGRPSMWGFITAVSTVIIIGALYLAMAPVVEQGSNGDYEAS